MGPFDLAQSRSWERDWYWLAQGRAEAGQLFRFCLLSFPVAPCKEFAVTMRPTEASDRCRLRGSYTLRTGESALELWGGPEPRTHFYSWPYRFLRRFGRDKVSRAAAGGWEKG